MPDPVAEDSAPATWLVASSTFDIFISSSTQKAIDSVEHAAILKPA
jgi:hypothetical protein